MAVGNHGNTSSRYSPLDSKRWDVERTCAQLLIYSGSKHPKAVTDLLLLQPTRTVAVGEVGRINSMGRAPIGKINGWFLSSEENVHSNDLRDHLNWLIDKLRPCAGPLRQLQETEGVRMYVSCPWWSRTGGGGPSLWPEQMMELAQLNLECTIDFADYSDEDDVQS